MLKLFQYKTSIRIHPELVMQLEYFLNSVLNVSDHGTFFDRIKKNTDRILCWAIISLHLYLL